MASEEPRSQMRDDFGRTITVAGTPGMVHIIVPIPDGTMSVRLSGERLDEFARLWVAAHHRAEAHAAERPQEVRDGG